MPADNPLKINFQIWIYTLFFEPTKFEMDFNDGATEHLVQNSSGKWIPAIIFVESKKIREMGRVTVNGIYFIYAVKNNNLWNLIHFY